MSAFNDLADVVRSVYEVSGGLTVPQMTSIISSGASDRQDVINFIQRTQTSVIVPPTIEYVGRYAFSGSSDLTQVKCLGNITSLSDYAFYNCANLSDIKVTNKLTSVGNSALYTGNTSLTVRISSALDSGVSYIANSAFYGCTGVETFFIECSITELKENSFAGCDAIYFKIPSGISKVATNALYNCPRLMDSGYISIYDCGVMHERAFSGVQCNAAIVLEGGISYIADEYFSGSDIKSIAIPSSLVEIGDSVFFGCTNLDEVVIPESVLVMGKFCFYNSSVRSITFKGSTNIGESCFVACSSLTDVVFNGAVSIGKDCFRGCMNLTEISLPEGVYVGDNAFYGSGITTLILSSSCILGDSCFAACSSLTNVTIPSGVQFIGEKQFANCINLSSVYYGASDMTEAMFYGCTSLTSMDVSSVSSIPNDVFSGCSSLTYLTGTAGKYIGSGAIRGTRIRTYDLGTCSNPSETCFSGADSLRTVQCSFKYYISDVYKIRNTDIAVPWGKTGDLETGDVLTIVFPDANIKRPFPAGLYCVRRGAYWSDDQGATWNEDVPEHYDLFHNDTESEDHIDKQPDVWLLYTESTISGPYDSPEGVSCP